MAIASTFPAAVVFGDTNQTVYLVNSGGTVQTVFLLYGNLTAAPAFYGGVAFFGESSTGGSAVHAIDVVTGTDLFGGGKGIQVNGSVDATPALSQDQVLYVAASNGALYAFDVQNPANATQLWTLTVVSGGAAITSVILSHDESRLYLATAKGIYAVQLQGRGVAGSVLWNTSTSQSFVQGVPILTDRYLVGASGSTLYGFDVSGTPSGGVLPSAWSYVATQTLYAPMDMDCVHALIGDTSQAFHVVEMATGNQVATVSPGLSTAAMQASALWNGNTLVTTGGAAQVSLTQIGFSAWFGGQYQSGWSYAVAGSTFASAPYASATIVYAVSNQGTVYSLDASSGALLGQQSLPTGTTGPFSPPQVVPVVGAVQGSVSFLLDGLAYFTTLKNLLIAARNGSLSNGSNPPSPPTFENLVTAVGGAGSNVYVLMWDTSTANYVMEQMDIVGAFSTLVSTRRGTDKLVNMKTDCNLRSEANVATYLEPYPQFNPGFWREAWLLGQLGALSQHQKMGVFCVAGTKLALVAGLNLSASNYDTAAHPMSGTEGSENTYSGKHDTAVLIQGPAVAAVEAEFDRRWAKSGGSSANPATSTYVKISGWAIHHDLCLDAPDVCSGSTSPTPFQNPSLTSAQVPLQVLVTNLDNPDEPVRQIQAAIIRQVAAAQSYVYFENFALHDVGIVQALVGQLQNTSSSCTVIIMLPYPGVGEPLQEVMNRCAYALLLLASGEWTTLTYDSYTWGVQNIGGMMVPAQLYQGQATVQQSQVTSVHVKYGSSVYDTEVHYQLSGSSDTLSFTMRYLLSLTPAAFSSSSRLIYSSPARYYATPQAGNNANIMRGVAANYRGIYIHSKLALFDDKVAILGSGNFNGRSMMYDGEMSVQISDATTVAGIRSALFTHWGMQTGSSWSPANWYTLMNAFATAPTDGAIGAYPLAFTALAATWPRRAAQGIFDVFNVDPGTVL